MEGISTYMFAVFTGAREYDKLLLSEVIRALCGAARTSRHEQRQDFTQSCIWVGDGFPLSVSMPVYLMEYWHERSNGTRDGVKEEFNNYVGNRNELIDISHEYSKITSTVRSNAD